MRTGVVAANLILAVDGQIFDAHAEQWAAAGPSLTLFAVTGLDAIIRQLEPELHRAAEALTAFHFASHVFSPHLECGLKANLTLAIKKTGYTGCLVRSAGQ